MKIVISKNTQIIDIILEHMKEVTNQDLLHEIIMLFGSISNDFKLADYIVSKDFLISAK